MGKALCPALLTAGKTPRVLVCTPAPWVTPPAAARAQAGARAPPRAGRPVVAPPCRRGGRAQRAAPASGPACARACRRRLPHSPEPGGCQRSRRGACRAAGPWRDSGPAGAAPGGGNRAARAPSRPPAIPGEAAPHPAARRAVSYRSRRAAPPGRLAARPCRRAGGRAEGG